MKQIKITLCLLLLCSIVGMFCAPNALAASVEVVGNVGNPTTDVQGSTVLFRDATTKQIVSQTTVDPSGVYSTAVPKGTYDIIIKPPAQSHIPSITKTNQTISGNSEVNFTLPNAPEKQPAKINYTGIILIIGVIAVIAVIGYFVKW